MILRLVKAPSSEPIQLSDVEGQTRLQNQLTPEKDTIELMIQSVRETAEGWLKRGLITQQWQLDLNTFPKGREKLVIPLPPLQTIDSIIYIDTTGTEQTLDPSLYKVVSDNSPNCNPGFIVPVYGTVWPTTLDDYSVVSILFTCGYGPAEENGPMNVPAGILQWMLIQVANAIENRETVGVAYRETKFDITDAIANGLIEKYRITKL